MPGLRREAELGCDLGDVRALIAVVGGLGSLGAGLQRRAEELDLAAGVVEVVLPADVMAGELEEAGQTVAIGGIAGRRDRDRPGWVAGHVLDQDPLGVGGRTRSVPRPVAKDALHGPPVPARRHPQVDEARPGHLGRGDVV